MDGGGEGICVSSASSHAQERGLEVNFGEGDRYGLFPGLRLLSPLLSVLERPGLCPVPR